MFFPSKFPCSFSFSQDLMMFFPQNFLFFSNSNWCFSHQNFFVLQSFSFSFLLLLCFFFFLSQVYKARTKETTKWTSVVARKETKVIWGFSWPTFYEVESQVISSRTMRVSEMKTREDFGNERKLHLPLTFSLSHALREDASTFHVLLSCSLYYRYYHILMCSAFTQVALLLSEKDILYISIDNLFSFSISSSIVASIPIILLFLFASVPSPRRKHNPMSKKFHHKDSQPSTDNNSQPAPPQHTAASSLPFHRPVRLMGSTSTTALSRPRPSVNLPTPDLEPRGGA